MNDVTLPPHLEGQSSWLSKSTSARVLGHPLVWSLVTGLLILAGYLWLQNFSQPLPAANQNVHSDAELIGANKGNDWSPEIYKPITTQDIMPITREEDEVRASSYRTIIEQENLIQPMLSRAREYLDREQYVTNNPQNAWTSYQNILEVDPGHKLALSGQAQILQILQENAEIALEASEYNAVERWLTQLDIIRPSNMFQTDLRRKMAEQIRIELAAAEVAQREAERLQNLKSALDIANTAMLSTPANLSEAFDTYHRALEIDESNETAKSGLRQILNKRVTFAKLAIANNDFNAAQRQIDKLQSSQAPTKIITELEVSFQMAKARAQAPKEPISIENKNPSSDETQNKLPVASEAQIEKPDLSSEEKQNLPAESDQSVTVAPETLPAENETVQTEQQQRPILTSSVDETTLPPTADKAQLNAGIKAYYAGNYSAAFEKLHPLAEENNARAQFRIGMMYYRGRTVVQNQDLARQWITRSIPNIIQAAERNEAWAQADLGAAYEMGVGLNRDVKRAAALYQKSAAKGYAGAQTNLGVLYGTGDGVGYDRKLAIHWLKKAAEQGDKIARDNLNILNVR